MWGDYGRNGIQKFFRRVLGRVAKVLLWHERNRVSTPALPARAASTPRGTEPQNSISCRSSSRKAFRSRLKREYRAVATGSTCFGVHTPLDGAGSRLTVVRTRKDRDRKERRVRLPSGETRSEKHQRHLRALRSRNRQAMDGPGQPPTPRRV